MEPGRRTFGQDDILRPTRRQGQGTPPPTPQEIARSEVRFPDYYSPPADATSFTRTDWWDSPAAVGTNSPAGLQFQLPEGQVGIIRNFALYVNDMVAADLIDWTLRINEAGVPNWNAVKMFPTLASFRTVSDDPFVFVPESGKIDVLINNASGLAKRIGANYYGWYWPLRKA